MSSTPAFLETEAASTEASRRGVEPDLADALAELASLRFAELDSSAVLARITYLARETISDVAAASITVVPAEVEPSTAAFAGPLALALDETQYVAGYGPCLDAARQLSVNLIVDMADEARWPEFTAAALSRGVTGSLSVGVRISADLVGCLNLYGNGQTPFNDRSVDLARVFAGYAAVAIDNSRLHERATRVAAQLATAMESRAVIEQAKGVLMAQRGVDADAAFTFLAGASQRDNRKVRDIAQGIVDGTAG